MVVSLTQAWASELTYRGTWCIPFELRGTCWLAIKFRHCQCFHHGWLYRIAVPGRPNGLRRSSYSHAGVTGINGQTPQRGEIAQCLKHPAIWRRGCVCLARRAAAVSASGCAGSVCVLGCVRLHCDYFRAGATGTNTGKAICTCPTHANHGAVGGLVASDHGDWHTVGRPCSEILDPRPAHRSDRLALVTVSSPNRDRAVERAAETLRLHRAPRWSTRSKARCEPRWD